MERKIAILLLVFSLTSVKSQQTVVFSQYFNNSVIYNPAITGASNNSVFIFQTRQQWLGFEGAPLSANFSYNGALNNRSSIGGHIEHDRTFPSNQTNLNINYAYHVPLNADDTYVSFGIGAKGMYYYLDFEKGQLPPGQDPAYTEKSFEQILGDASSGVYLYNKRFYAGYSVLNMLQSSFNNEVSYGFSNNNIERVYYGILGYKIRLDRDWHLEPSVLIRHLENGDPEYNFSTRVFYTEQICTGVSIGSNSSLSLYIGTNADKVKFGYSFDHYFGEISQYQLGTHEFTMSVSIPNNRKY